MSVAAINIATEGPSIDELVRAVEGADVVVLIEIHNGIRRELVQQGFARAYPHQIHVGTGPAGTSIYSRIPIDDLGHGNTAFGSPLARVLHESGPILVMGVHPLNPMGGKDEWVTDARNLREHIRPWLAEPLVVAGDFNAIDRHATMRPLLEEDGLSSVAELTGAGPRRTWPATGRAAVAGPLIGIDHVLISPRMAALSYREFRVAHTDHLGMWVEVARRT